MDSDVQFRLENKELAYLNLPWATIKRILNSHDTPMAPMTDNPVVDLLNIIRDPKNFAFTCKYILNREIAPFQNVILRELWNCPFPILLGSRGAAKSSNLAFYISLRSTINQGYKTAITGLVFRQSKVVMGYIEDLWSKAPIWRDMMSDVKSGISHTQDLWSINIGESVAFACPLGDGSRVRGLRANCLITDEFATINPEIYETVLAGFTAVSASPIENMKRQAAIKLLRKEGLWTQEHDENVRLNYKGNQVIIAGTVYYSFNHLFKYWKQYKEIIESGGDINKILDIHDGKEPEKGFYWKDRKIFRIPIELIPEGFMDEKSIARSKLHQSTSLYNCEYGACFITDSDGFFRRALIEHCTTSEPIQRMEGPVQFKAVLKGDPNKKYFIGVDPASEQDNFSIVVVEQNQDHGRIVYCWTTTNKRHKDLVRKGLVKEHDFYRYTARKIRDLMKVFPTEVITIDSQGGGRAVAEALREPANLEPGEHVILPIDQYHPLSDGKEKPTDDEAGLHIVEFAHFVKADYTSEANHGLRKDFETQEMLFPFFDGLEVGLSAAEDEREGRMQDTLEQCILEIQELKDELSSIVVIPTPSGRDHWDTPEIKEGANKKGRLRKDRYSALLMAAYACRRMRRVPIQLEYPMIGAFANNVPQAKSKQLYVGPSWFTEGLSSGGGMHGMAINRNRIDD